MQLTDRSLVWNTDLTEACELDNLLVNSAITMHSAEARKVPPPPPKPPEGLLIHTRLGKRKSCTPHLWWHTSDYCMS